MLDRNTVCKPERVKTLTGQAKKTAVLQCTDPLAPSGYRARRAVRIAQSLKEAGIDVIFLSGHPLPNAEEAGFRTEQISGRNALLTAVERLQPDVLLRDERRSDPAEAAALRQLVPAIIHFDDDGEGSSEADLVFRTLYREPRGETPPNVVTGPAGFIADPSLLRHRRAGVKKEAPGNLPHIVVAHGPEDPGDLSRRTLRHLTQLQIPLKVTVLLGEAYAHPADQLQMMALSRRNVKVKRMPYDYGEELAAADIVICSSGHIPYDVAFLSIPCIVLAQDEEELAHAFPTEDNGFLPLGLGRKVKQSMLLNAVMEYLLHEPRRRRAVSRQAALGVEDGIGAVSEAVFYYLEYPPRRPADR